MSIDPDRGYQAALDAAIGGVEYVASVADDPEAAHGNEDELRADVLRWIARHGDEQSRTMAAVALMTGTISFPRMCA